MINEKVLDFLKAKGYADRLTEHKETIDTVEHAAQQIGCSEAEIAKTLSFIVDEKPVIVVMACDGRGNSFTSVKLTPSELEEVSGATGWCDVCKGWEE